MPREKLQNSEPMTLPNIFFEHQLLKLSMNHLATFRLCSNGGAPSNGAPYL